MSSISITARLWRTPLSEISLTTTGSSHSSIPSPRPFRTLSNDLFTPSPLGPPSRRIHVLISGPLTQLVKRPLSIHNPNSQPIAFKVKTTAPRQYCVRPNSGRVDSGETVEVQGESSHGKIRYKRAHDCLHRTPWPTTSILRYGVFRLSYTVLLQPFGTEPPPHAKCKDKFLVQSAYIGPDEESRTLAEIVSEQISQPRGCNADRSITLLSLTFHRDIVLLTTSGHKRRRPIRRQYTNKRSSARFWLRKMGRRVSTGYPRRMRRRMEEIRVGSKSR